jgi:hypothetical protein
MLNQCQSSRSLAVDARPPTPSLDPLRGETPLKQSLLCLLMRRATRPLRTQPPVIAVRGGNKASQHLCSPTSTSQHIPNPIYLPPTPYPPW